MSTYKEEIIRLREEGKSYNEISKILGAAKSTINYHVRYDKEPQPDPREKFTDQFWRNVQIELDYRKIFKFNS